MTSFLAMRPVLALSAFFLLSACQGVGGTAPLDGRTFLSSLEGPKVPTVQDSLTETAKAAEQRGDFKSAAQLYQQILEKKPEDKDTMLNLAEALRRGGEYDRAVALYDALLQKDPAITAAKESKALALLSQGDFDTPAVLLDEVLKAEPTRWKTLNALGILFATRDMHAEAQQYFNEALKQNPSNPTALNNLGLSQALNRDFDGAIASLSQASALSSEPARIDLNLALVYAIAGRLDDANALAMHHLTGPALDNNRGLYAHLAKDDQMAKSYLNMALTGSKTFYEKAWDNLQAIEGGAGSAPSPSAGDPEVKVKSKAKAKRSTPKASTPKPDPADDEITNIIGDTGETK